MSASTVVAVEPDRQQSVAWAMTAVAVGLVAPRLADDWISNIPFQNLLTSYYIVWAATSVGITFLAIGCSWLYAIRGPVSGDRVGNLLLALMSLALAAFLFLSNIPYLGAQIETRNGVALAPPFLQHGLVTAMGYLVFGLSLSGVFGWRGFQRSTHLERGSGSVHRWASRALILLVTFAAGYMALATHVEQVLRD
jgi:hypothetical protein